MSKKKRKKRKRLRELKRLQRKIAKLLEEMTWQEIFGIDEWV